MDAAATLTHDIEKVWQDGEVLTALALDIKVAFDNVTAKDLQLIFRKKTSLSPL